MTCKRTDKLMEKALFGELIKEEKLHVTECRACGEVMNALQKADAVLKASRGESAPPDLTHDLWERIEARLSPVPAAAVRPPRLLPRRLVPLAAAAAAVMAIGLWVVMERDKPRSDLEIVQGGIPNAEFYMSEHLSAELGSIYAAPSKGS